MIDQKKFNEAVARLENNTAAEDDWRYLDQAILRDYDPSYATCQGKTPQQEAEDSMSMLIEVAVYVVAVVAAGIIAWALLA